MQSTTKFKVSLSARSKQVHYTPQYCIWLLLKPLNKLHAIDGNVYSLLASRGSQEHWLGRDQEMRRNQAEQNNPWSMVMEITQTKG